ncbi:MAG: hypothetical protein OEM67_10125 [Thermoleophilia bacterium]|nr:hypothetical protein [Thermoleophilia bacterium]
MSNTSADAAAALYVDVEHALAYSCDTCKNEFDEETVEAVIKRAAANTHGEAITPGLESIYLLAQMREAAGALLVYECETCKGEFDEETVQAVLKRAAANGHGKAITAELEGVTS